jgi:peptidoglycan/LPS O-acetylase OafA/YrhL
MGPQNRTVSTLNPVVRASQHRFHLLDALRGVAALLVVIRHAPQPIPTWAVTHTYSSFLAVDFFFCLSGFVIAFAYEERLASGLSFREFTLARVIRLYPLIVLGTLIGFVSHYLFLSPINHPSLAHEAKSLLSGLLLVPDISNHNSVAFELNAPLWSLICEVVANLFYAFLVYRRVVRTWVIAAITLIFATLLILVIMHNGTVDGGVAVRDLYIGFIRVGVSFSLGVLLARMRRQSAPAGIQGRIATFSAIGLVIVFLVLLCMPGRESTLRWSELATIFLLFPAVVYLGASIILGKTGNTISAFFGDVSYPLYVLHTPLMAFIPSGSLLLLLGSHAALGKSTVAVTFALLVFLSWGIAKYLDTPVRAWLSSRLKKSRMRIQPKPAYREAA